MADATISVDFTTNVKQQIAEYEAWRQKMLASGKTAGELDSILGRLQRQAELYAKGMQEATRVDNLEKYRAKLNAVQTEMANLQRGTAAAGAKGASSFNGLQNSINQISRELPAFTYSAQTGFLAISNNIPILVDELGRLKAANTALTANGQAAKPVWSQLIGSLFSWGTALSVGVTLLTIYGKEIGDFFAQMFRGKTTINQAAENFKALNSVMADAAKSAAAEIAQMRIYYGIATDVSRSVKERTEAAKKLQEQYPAGFANARTQAILNGEEKKTYDELTLSILKTAKAKAAQKKIEENTSKQIEIEFQQEKIRNANANEKKRYAEQGDDGNLTNINATTGTINQTKGATVAEKKAASDARAKLALTETANQLKSIEVQNDFLLKFINAGSTKVTGLINQKKQQISEAQDALDKATTPAKQAELRTRIEGLNKELAQMTGSGEKAAQASAARLATQTENARQKLIDSREAILRRGAELDAEYSRKSLDSDAAEIQAVRDKYAAMRKTIEAENAKIRKFNANPKNKVKVAEVDLSDFDNKTQSAVGNVQEKQSIERTKTEIAQKKELYAALEAYKLKLGESEAEKLFEKQLQGAKSYADLLKSEIAKIETTPEADRSGNQVDFLKYLKSEQEKNNTAQQEADRKRYEEAFTAATTTNERIFNIQKKYIAQRAELERITDEKLRSEKIAQSFASEAQEVESARAENFAKTELFRRFNSDVLSLTKQGLKVRIAAIKEALSAENIIPPDLRAKLEAELGQAQKVLGGNDYAVRKKEAQERIKDAKQILASSEADAGAKERAAQALHAAKGDLASLAVEKMQNLAASASQIGADLQGLGTAIAQFDQGLGDTVNTAGQLLSTVGDLSSAILSGDPAKILGSVIKGVVTLLNLRAAARESERKSAEELKKFNEEAKKGELEYQALLRERERQIVRNNKLTKEGLTDQSELLKQQQIQINQQYSSVLQRLQAEQYVSGKQTYQYGGFLGIGRKTGVRDVTASLAGKSYEDLEKLYTEGKLTEGAKALFEQLKKLKEEGANVSQALADAAKEAQELYTGTTASSITDAIVEGFKNGKRSASDFAEDFEELMQDALLNTFKYSIVEAQVQDFYKKFAEAAQAEGGLTPDKVKALQDEYKKMIDGQAKQFEQLQQVTGINSNENQARANSLAGAVKGITATQADLLAGQFGGLRLAQLATNELIKSGGRTQSDSLAAIRESVLALKNIEIHTKTMADNSRYLEDIKKGIDKLNSDDRRSNGL